MSDDEIINSELEEVPLLDMKEFKEEETPTTITMTFDEYVESQAKEINTDDTYDEVIEIG